jgi:periplasmic protein TonB
MSYVEQTRAQKPISMAAAVAVNGAIIVAIMLSPMVVNPPKPPLITHTVFVEPIKPPPKPVDDAQIEPRPFDPVTVPPPPFPNAIPDNPIRTTFDPPSLPQGPVAGTGSGEGLGGGIVKVDPPVPPLRKATRDPRYAADFQPMYPTALINREIEGSATIRVLVGTDGRVRQAIVVSATHPDFGKAAMRQALKAWRFKPAMRGDIAVEDWVTLPVTFVIN